MIQSTVNDVEYYIPDHIPPEVQAYGSKLAQLAVGKAGKLGGLILTLEKDSENNKTTVKEQYSRVPLFTQRALYLEEALPEMAYLYIISPSGGILQGDRYRMDIRLRKSAKAHITTQGATRIYRMDKNFATQVMNIDVDEGCYFEYIPDQVIPFRDSRFYQVANLRVHDSATLLYSEIITPGRVARGEIFEYDICYMKAIATNQNGNLRFADVAMLEPKKRDIRLFGILEKYETVGSMYVLAPAKHVAELNAQIASSLNLSKDILAGATILPHNSGIMVRMLGDTASTIRNAMFEVVRATRKVILNAPFSGIRKG